MAGAAPTGCPACLPTPVTSKPGVRKPRPSCAVRPASTSSSLIERKGGSQSPPAQVQQTHARHILVKTSEVGECPTPTPAGRLVDLRERIVQGGASFADLARQHSADISAAKGGDLAGSTRATPCPNFEQAMDALKPGGINSRSSRPLAGT